MAGYISQAFGAVFAGFYIRVMSDNFDYTKEALVTNVVRFYALIGLLMFVGYFFMDRKEI